MNSTPDPSPLTPDSDFLVGHVAILRHSLKRWGGPELAPPELDDRAAARFLFEAPFALLSHNTNPDPVFNYANRTALELFELTWEECMLMPSRLSAEPLHRDERARLLAEVTAHGLIRNYRGIRISKNGKRFMIEDGTVWNLVDQTGRPCGQAASFSRWTFL